MDEKYFLEMAARAWCDPKTSDRIMDVELATVFARFLMDAFNIGRVHQAKLDREVVRGEYIDKCNQSLFDVGVKNGLEIAILALSTVAPK